MNMAKTFELLFYKKIRNSTFRNVIGIVNSFLPLFLYYEILFVHKFKMAATAILENIYLTFFVRERCVISIVSVNFASESIF